MEVGESFCSACGRPSIWATHDERVAWEVEQWRAVNGPKRQEVHTPILSVRAFRDAQRPPPEDEEPAPQPVPAPQLVAAAEPVSEPREEVVVRAPDLAPVAPAEVVSRPPEPLAPVLAPEPVEPVPVLRAVPEPVLHVVPEPVTPADEADPIDRTLALLAQISDRLTAIEGQLALLNRSRWTRVRSFLAGIFAYPEA